MNDFSPEFFENAKNAITNGKIQYLNQAGLVVDKMEQRHIVTHLPVDPLHMNHVGIVYAGSYFMLAEASGASLLKCTYGSKYVAIIKSANLDYLRPAKTDLVVDISMTEEESEERIAYVKANGKGRYPMEIPVMDSTGELCAKVNVVYYLMPNTQA